MPSNALALGARAGLSAIFLWSAVGKMRAPEAVIDYIAASGVPYPHLAWLAAVAVELIGGLLLLGGVCARGTAVVLAGFSLAAAGIFHRDLADEDQLTHALKNLAMAGGLLQVAAFGPGGWRLARLERALVGVSPAEA